MSSLRESLQEHPFFKGMSDEHIGRLEAVARPVWAEPNDFVFRQGGAADCFLVLVQGDLAIELHAGGRSARIIHTVHAGEVVGWSWMHSPHRWMFDGRALNAVECLCLDGEAVRKLMEEDHEFGYQLLRRFSEPIVEELNATRMQLLDVYGDSH